VGLFPPEYSSEGIRLLFSHWRLMLFPFHFVSLPHNNEARLPLVGSIISFGIPQKKQPEGERQNNATERRALPDFPMVGIKRSKGWNFYEFLCFPWRSVFQGLPLHSVQLPS
jgi:hypothetical protein